MRPGTESTESPLQAILPAGSTKICTLKSRRAAAQPCSLRILPCRRHSASSALQRAQGFDRFPHGSTPQGVREMMPFPALRTRGTLGDSRKSARGKDGFKGKLLVGPMRGRLEQSRWRCDIEFGGAYLPQSCRRHTRKKSQIHPQSARARTSTCS